MTELNELTVLNIGKSMCNAEQERRVGTNGHTFSGHVIGGLRDNPILFREAIRMLDEVRA